MLLPRFHLVFLSLLTLLTTVNLPAQQPLDGRPDTVREKDPALRADGQELFFARPDAPGNPGSDDALLRYEPYLHNGEHPVTSRSNATAAFSRNQYAARSVAAGTTTSSDRTRPQRGITPQKTSRKRRAAERRPYDLTTPKTTDPERKALRNRYRLSNGIADTLPPRGNSVRDKYARDLRELELMKDKFRRQQENKLRERGGSRVEWTPRSSTIPTPNADGAPASATDIPSIGKSYTPPPYVDPRETARKARTDSLQLDARVRSGLYPNRRPAAHEREAWEYSVRHDLPHTEPLSPEESARLDAQYQRKQAELAALKARLNRLNENAPAPVGAPNAGQQPFAGQQPYVKDQPYAAPQNQSVETQRPAAHGLPSTNTGWAAPPRPATEYDKRPGVSAGISFITNTAYPDGAGYTGLDQLVRQLRNGGKSLEVHVHTPVQMDRRAAQLLSEERAVSIRNYLLEQRIPPHQFKVIGFGNNLTGSGGERVEVLR